MKMYKGDVVICMDSGGSKLLDKGNEYIIYDVDRVTRNIHIKFNDESNSSGSYSPKRFILSIDEENE